MGKILRKSHQAHFSKLSAFVGHKSILCHHFIQYVKEYKINKERVTQFISIKVKKT